MNKCIAVSRNLVITGVVLALLLVLLPAEICLAADAEPAGGPAVKIIIGEKGVSVHAVGAQADELFRKLARATGVGIIVDDTVGRRDGGKFTSRLLTVHLADKKVSEIIENICTAYGLSHSQKDSIFMISEGIPKNPSSYLLSDVDSVTTQYVPASSAKSLLPVFLQDHVKVNREQNAVILSAPSEVLQKFREDVKQFDVPASQIMIDVIMVEFTDSAAKELGFDFLWSNSGKAGSSSSSAGDILFRTLGTLTQGFQAQLKALVENKKARVHANPRIATVSGQAASIFVGRQRYLSQTVDMGGKSVNFIDAGIRLDMTPWTGGDGEIIAAVDPEVSVMSAPDPVTGLPEKSTRRASTIVRVKDGDTIIIGGLLQNELHSTKTRVPILGSLPLVGSLFSGTNRSEVKTELVIFVTPHILSQTGHLPAEQEQQLKSKLGINLEGTR